MAVKRLSFRQEIKISISWKILISLACIWKFHYYSFLHKHNRWIGIGIIINAITFITPCFCLNTLRPKQNGRCFPDDIFKYIFLNENVGISLMISLKFIPKVRINNIPALVQIMAWRRPGDKPLSEPMMVRLPTHVCVTRPQWFDRYEQLYWWFIGKKIHHITKILLCLAVIM